MAKAVLVMDMPKDCYDCQLGVIADWTNELFCAGKDKAVNNCIPNKKPDGCPLKLMPEKAVKSIHDSDEMWFWNQGWNACIDKILGGMGG